MNDHFTPDERAKFDAHTAASIAVTNHVDDHRVAIIGATPSMLTQIAINAYVKSIDSQYVMAMRPRDGAPPSHWRDECLGAWETGHDDQPVSAWPDGYIALPNGDFMSIDHGRRLAAAILTACERAEKETHE